MAVELATAYVSIVPSTRGLAQQLKKDVGQPIERQADESGRSFGQRFSGAAVGLASKALKAGGATVASTFAASLVGGVRRLTGLENAAKQLENMGLSAAQSQTLMDALNDTLTGTPYALNEGAGAMANFVSSGMDLDTIPGVLDMVADAAAFGQAPLGEVAEIFNQVALNGKLSTNELRMLQQRGIPAFALLADAAGVTGEELQRMVSAGEIGADEFFDLWEQGAQGFGDANIRMVGSAQGMGDTTSGALSNMLTAFSRFGATIAGPFFDAARGVFAGVTDWVNNLDEVAGPMVERFAAGLSSAFGTIRRVAGPIIGWLSDAISSFGRTTSDTGSWISRTLHQVRDVFSTVLDAVRAAVAFFVEGALAAWDLFGDTILSYVIDTWGNVQTFISGALDVIRGVFDVFAGVFSGDWSRVWEGVKAVVTGVWNAIRALVNQAINAVRSVISAALDLIFGNWRRTWGNVQTTVANVWGSIRSAVSTAVNAVSSTISSVINGVKSTWDRVWGAIRGTFTTVMNGVRDTARSIMDAVKRAFERGVDGISRVWETIKRVTGAPINWVIDFVYNRGIRAFWNRIARWIPGISEIGELPRLAFNRGGAVPGGGPDRDSVLAALTPGEYVVNRRSTSLFAPLLEWMNSVRSRSAARRGIGRTGGDLSSLAGQGLNRGGYVKDPDDVLDWARRNSGPYQWGGFGPRFDCSGFMAALSNYAATGNFRSGGRWATGMAGGQRLGRFVRGEGDGGDGFAIGVRRGDPGHTAGTIAHVNVESSSSRGAHVGGARGWTYGSMRYHLPDFGLDWGLVDIARNLWDTIRHGTSEFGEFSGWISGAGRVPGEALMDWAWGKIPFGNRIRRLVGLESGAWVTGPTPALIGEGRHHEIVAPEPMLRRIVAEEFTAADMRPVDVTIDLGEGITRRLRIEQARDGRTEARMLTQMGAA